ncbi:MAG TPA: hypothetical protein VIJ04_13385 [Xanthobacteraceae bacterium]
MPLYHASLDARLADELQGVSDDAKQFIDYVRNDNALPATFPREHAEKLVRSLIGLQLGTAAGAKDPLEYARARLARMRSDHIVPESSTREMGDSVPPVTRGLTLDNLLIRLLASVSTALDTYYQFSDLEDEDEQQFDASVERKSHLNELNSVNQSTHKIAETADNFGKEFSKIRNPQSATSDLLLRQTHDVANLTKLVEAEAQLTAISAKWIRRFGEAFQFYSKTLRLTGNLIKIGTDVAEIIWNRWHTLKGRFGDVLIEETRKLGENLSSLGAQYEREMTKGDLKLASDDVRGQNIFTRRQALEQLILEGSAQLAGAVIEEYAGEYTDVLALDFLKQQASNGTWYTQIACISLFVKRLHLTTDVPILRVNEDELRAIFLSVLQSAIVTNEGRKAFLQPAAIRQLRSSIIIEFLKEFLFSEVDFKVRSLSLSILVRMYEGTYERAIAQSIEQLIGQKNSRLYEQLQIELQPRNFQTVKEAVHVLSSLSGKLRGKTPEYIYSALQQILSDPLLDERDRPVVQSILRGRRS